MPGAAGFPLITQITAGGWTAGPTLAGLIDGDADGRALIDAPPPGSQVRVRVELIEPEGETIVVIEEWSRPAAPGDLIRIVPAVEIGLVLAAERDAEATRARAAG